MQMPVIIAVIIGVIYFASVILFNIIREWWRFKKQANQALNQVNESERPAIVKPKRFYKGKGL
jgi:hypothetical protein